MDKQWTIREKISYYYDLFENITLDEYLRDKSVDDIIDTIQLLSEINNSVFTQLIDYFNTEPEKDLNYTPRIPKICTVNTKSQSGYDAVSNTPLLTGSTWNNDTDRINQESDIAKYCTKCLFPHDDTHKCYAYDRIFLHCVLENVGDGDGSHLEFENKYVYDSQCKQAEGRYKYDYIDYGGCRGYDRGYIKIGKIWVKRICRNLHCEAIMQCNEPTN